MGKKKFSRYLKERYTEHIQWLHANGFSEAFMTYDDFINAYIDELRIEYKATYEVDE